MRTAHYGFGLTPIAMAGELVDDFGDVIEWERVDDAIQWPGLPAWRAAFDFKASGLEAI